MRSSMRGLSFLAIVAAFGAGCASAPPKPSDEFVWPRPPDKPRVRYVRTIRTAADLPASGWERFRRAILGGDRTALIGNPAGVALSPDDTRLYVSCPAEGRVVELDLKQGKVRLAANEDGRRAKHPVGLATDADANLYVADQGEQTVWVYRPDGGFLREIGRGKLQRPTGLAIDRRRKVLYVTEGGRVEDQRHQVEVFALDGRHLRTIGTRGDEPGEFNFPGYLAVGPNGTLYVGDTLNFRIQMFDPNGALLGFFGQGGTNVGSFNKLKGLAFDSAGLLHVADAGNSAVQIFNSRQQLLMHYGAPGARNELLASPNGLAIDAKNNVYVADLVANRVNHYVLTDTSGADSDEPSPQRSKPPPPKIPSPPAPAAAPAPAPARSPGSLLPPPPPPPARR